MKSLFFILGACLGSFGACVGSRLPELAPKEFWKALSGRSRCDGCGRTLPPADLIPIVGYVNLKGKCRYCRKQIPRVYPLAEFFTGLACLRAFNIWGFSWETFATLLICTALAAVAVSDWLYEVIPDECSAALVALGFVRAALPLKNAPRLIDALLGGAICFSLFFGISLLYPGGLGGGDVKLAGALGVLAGLKLGIQVLCLSFVGAAAFALPLLIMRKLSPKDTLPLGVFMSASWVLVTLFEMRMFI